jgi:hypothetical protein
MAYKYKKYTESDTVQKYGKLKDMYLKREPKAWDGGNYLDPMNKSMQDYIDYGPFKYDLNADMLYNQYKDQYTNLGQMAMKDTTAQMSGLTGGYGNSYAATAGQQAYQGYLQQLNNVIPELYQLALNRYNSEGDRLLNIYGLNSDAYDREYGEHRDARADWRDMLDYITNQYNTERSWDYGMYSDEWDRGHTIERDKSDDNKWNKEYELSVENSKKSTGGSYSPKEEDTTVYTVENFINQMVRTPDNPYLNYSGSTSPLYGGKDIFGKSINLGEDWKNEVLEIAGEKFGKNSAEYKQISDYVLKSIRTGKWFV